MAGRLRSTVAGVLVALLLLPATDVLANPGTAPVRLLVTFTDPVDANELDRSLSTASLVDAPAAPSRVQLLELGHPAEVERVRGLLAVRGDVAAVEPDRDLEAAGRIERVLDVVVPDTVHSATDGELTLQQVAPTSAGSWGVRNLGRSVGGTAGLAGIDVGAPTAWSRSTGRDVVVAVIDSGVDIDHPLLRDRIWRNPGERLSGRDDDGNGYVDDLHGWNFVDGNNRVFVSEQLDAHGTHVAGIIAATAHAPSGFESVAPQARIMPLRFIAGHSGRTSDAIAALRYAEANGADVVNASWAADTGSPALRTVLAEMTIPVVLSAGNEGQQPGAPVGYPAAYGLANMVSVAALDADGSMARFSSRCADTVDVAAPGSRILSTYPGARLAEASGTSQAAPHVAGVLALALQRHPDADPVALARVVRDTVRPLAGATDTRAGGIARAPALLDALGTAIPACNGVGDLPFVDVGRDNVHHDAVACMLTRGVTRGTSATTYGAGADLSREQIATLVANALAPTGRLPAPPARDRYRDTAGSVHRDNIETLAAVGIVAVPGPRYEPTRTVTRAEFAAIVARAAEWLAGAEVRARGPAFDDIAGHPDAAGIEVAAGLRVISGRRPGVFSPEAPLRRDQAATMVTQLLDRLVQHGLLDPG